MGELAEKAIRLMHSTAEDSSKEDTQREPQNEIDACPSSDREEAVESKLQAAIRLVLEVFGGEVVDAPKLEPLSETGRALLPFLRGKIPDDWGEAHISAEARVLPGECEKCPACARWEGRGKEPFCFYEAKFLGKSAQAQLAKKRRGKCPLKRHHWQQVESIA